MRRGRPRVDGEAMLRNDPTTASEKGTVPFCSEDLAKLGQSPAVVESFLRAREREG